MRTVPPALAAHLAEGVTTLCRCWRLTRLDGVVLGFTDHDRDLAFGGVTYAARSGLEAAEASAELGFAVGGGDVAGALSAAGLTEADIAAGLYDDATVETFLVNWADPGARMQLATASIGEVRRADGAFVAELRGPAHRLDEECGRLYGASCSAALGDERCRVDLGSPAYRAEATVAATDGSSTLSADGLAAFPAGFFAGGTVAFLSGAEAGRTAAIKAHRLVGARATIDLWRRTARPIEPGDAIRVTAGCDKRLATCRDTFGNVANFRGFPHMPGNDFILRGIAPGEPGLDGGSLFR